jgi:hypothetical protein
MWAGRERLDTALKLVRRARRWARPNDGFLEQLAHFEVLLGLAGPARAWKGAAEGGGGGGIAAYAWGASPEGNDSTGNDAVATAAAEAARRSLRLNTTPERSRWPATLEGLWDSADPGGLQPRVAWVRGRKGRRGSKGPAHLFPFDSRCELCLLARTTRWYGVASHAAFALLDCDTCPGSPPMAVLRWHEEGWEGKGVGTRGEDREGEMAAAAAYSAARNPARARIRADMEAALLAAARSRGDAASAAPLAAGLLLAAGVRWEWRVDGEQRSIPGHAHAHARPVAAAVEGAVWGRGGGKGAGAENTMRSRL